MPSRGLIDTVKLFLERLSQHWKGVVAIGDLDFLQHDFNAVLCAAQRVRIPPAVKPAIRAGAARELQGSAA